ncbi:MAG: response regulator [Chthoniobacter sp.]|nr:response regulator [Chthoniobacter sp.]
MSHKRILLLHEDQLLANLFRDKLENANFGVTCAANAEEGLKVGATCQPDVVVMDSAVPGMEMGKLIPQLKALGGGAPLPVIVLPNARSIFSESAQEAGGVPLMRGVNPISDIVEAIQTALKMEKTTLLTKSLVFRAEDGWLKASLERAPEVLAEARRALHEISREGGAAAAAALYQRMHGFAEQMAILGQRPLHYLAAQIEALAYDLSKFPEQVNPSIVRTLSQALDFLATLLPDAVRLKLKDPGASEVLIVDDEDGARKIIMAAMRLANLKSMAADTPTTALAALGVQGFELIFLDVGLPEMTGFELCTKIRMLPLHEKTPIVFITGMATFQNRVQSSLSGGNDFVGKPFNISELGLKALIWVFKGQLGQI